MATQSTRHATGGEAPAASTGSGKKKAATAAPLPDTYEAARDELAAVVEKLEAGGLSLDESLAVWERGQSLATACETFLAGARKRVDDALAAADSAAAAPDADPDPDPDPEESRRGSRTA